MKKIILALILVCLCTSLGWAASKSEDYELQEKCGNKAHDRFKEGYGNGHSNDEDGTKYIYSQSNHYNRKLNKCFILIRGSSIKGNETSISEELWDINEEKQYGEFFDINMKITFCDVSGRQCHSQNEWNALIKPYMEE